MNMILTCAEAHHEVSSPSLPLRSDASPPESAAPSFSAQELDARADMRSAAGDAANHDSGERGTMTPAETGRRKGHPTQQTHR